MKKIKKYIELLLVLLIAAFNFNLILKPLNLVTGGNQGLAILLNHLLKISPALIILIINIIMLLISFFTLPKQTTYGTVLATFAYPFFVKLTSNLKIPIIDNYLIIYIILAGIICGVTGGIIYRLGFSNGGISVLPVVFNSYFHIKIYLTTFLLNALIVLLGCYYFGIVKCLYSILIIFLQSYLIKKVLNYHK